MQHAHLYQIDSSKMHLMPGLASYFDDNGGEPDGLLWLISDNEINQDPPKEMVVREGAGYMITDYAGGAGYDGHFCGWSSTGVAYAWSEDVLRDLPRSN